jgi:hypothetical protein
MEFVKESEEHRARVQPGCLPLRYAAIVVARLLADRQTIATGRMVSLVSASPNY